MHKIIREFIFTCWQNFHAIRRIELKKIKKFLYMNEKGTIHDLGCGKGFFCQVLNKAGNKVFGIDPI